jgi:DNA-binding beta-propeller fold protein YncE
MNRKILMIVAGIVVAGFLEVKVEGQTAYITNYFSNNVVCSTPHFPFGISISPDGSKVYAAIMEENSVSVIDAR